MIRTFVAGALLPLLVAGAAVARQGDAKALEAQLMAADRAWCQTVIDRDQAKFSETVAESATFRGAVGDPLVGRDAIVKGWSGYFTPGGATIRWNPSRAQVLGSGDVGYTSGQAERHMKDGSGKEVVVRSEYLTVWAHQPDGSWKVVFDTGAVLK